MNVRYIDNAKQILFNTEMVKAIIDGRKTETRRPFKVDLGLADTDKNDQTYLKIPDEYGDCHDAIDYVSIKVGDILYIRETWAHEDGWYEDTIDMAWKNIHIDGKCTWVDYKATEKDDEVAKWRPSIYMPKKFARIFLKVTGVRVERLSSITGEQATKEGVEAEFNLNYGFAFGKARSDFILLWDSIYEKDYPSSSNPWVIVYEFERLENQS